MVMSFMTYLQVDPMQTLMAHLKAEVLKHSGIYFCSVFFAICLLWTGSTIASADEASEFFESKIRPVLVERCYSCHSARADKLKGNLYLDSKSGWQTGGDSGEAVIVPGDPDASLLIRCIQHAEAGLEMPPNDEPLSDAIVADFVTWVRLGAFDPRDEVTTEIKRADKSWWSLQPLRETFAHNSIDAFIETELAEHGLAINEPADARTLIRRMTYDVLGLPPTEQEVWDFIDRFDTANNQSERDAVVSELIDRLLASPRYGEQWGRHWLDVVRFSESNGFERNFIINDLYFFRDYVVKSINDDKPFNQFFIEHLAGDIVGKDDPSIEVASSFLVAGPYDDVGNSDEVAKANIRAATIDDMITATGSAFLGLTIHCARCHHHKFDPIPTEDYYRLRACFEGTIHGRRTLATASQRTAYDEAVKPLNEKLNALLREKAEIKDSHATIDQRISEVNSEIAKVPALPQAWIGKHEAISAKTYVHQGGDPMKPLNEVIPSSLSILDQMLPGYLLASDADEGQRRLRLAQWIASDANALTVRVLANRVWQNHFGTGIVDTSNDFGFLGSQPTHPELLDFLARKLIQHEWKLKPLHRDILLSKAYRQSSTYRPEAAAIDQSSRLLWRYPPRRLQAEEIRDTILQVAGVLQVEPMGGPGFRLYDAYENNVSTYTPLEKVGPETYRRSVYHQNVRASIVDLLSDFDLPDTAFSSPKRSNTTTPLQALTMLNHSFIADMSAALASRITTQVESVSCVGEACRIERQIEALYQIMFQRAPTEAELMKSQEFIQNHGLAGCCRVLLNSNELIYVE
jgi:hypothetical protein